VNAQTIVLSAVLAATMPLAAQQSSSESVNPLRSQILTFEDALRRAIEVAGDELSKQVQEQLNTPILIQFGFEPAAPIVRGWPLTSYGYHFDVQVPDVAETGLRVLRMWEDPRRLAGVPPSAPASSELSRPVASGGVVTDDPMGAPPGGRASEPAAPRASFDPNAVYRANVRLALIDAILNSASVLNLRDTETLAVSAAGMGQSAAYRLNQRSARVTLYIRGADLTALREGRLTREQARARLTEKSF
jgi:hypothetical protein